MNTEHYNLETQIEIIREARRQGFDDATIAARLGLDEDDPALTIDLEGRPLGVALDGIGEGFREWEFFDLPEELKRPFLILAARIAEATYRRGLQQGFWAASNGQKFRIHPDKLRWDGYSLDDARMFLCGSKMTSIERLSIQHGGILQALGFGVVDDPLQ
jgi:hypothetical protein